MVSLLASIAILNKKIDDGIDVSEINKDLSKITSVVVQRGVFDVQDLSELATLVGRVRQLNTSSSERNDSLFLNFKRGDRLYGRSTENGTLPYLHLLGPHLGEGEIIMDHVNDLFRFQRPVQDIPDVGISGSPHFVDKTEYARTSKEYATFFKNYPSISKLDIDRDKDSNDMINRCCKAGILCTLLRGHKVHFALNGLDIEASRTKADKTGGASVPGYFTNKELRFIYRLCKRHPNFRQNFSFWKDDKEVQAPWETNSAEWSKYKPKEVNFRVSMEKYCPSWTRRYGKVAIIAGITGLSVLMSGIGILAY
jgi:hypothetical protein